MWFDRADGEGVFDAAQVSSEADVRWSIVLPFYNERAYIADTLASLAKQTLPFRLILVDNGSTDGGGDAAAFACRRLGLAYALVSEQRPGKVNALKTGLARVATEFVATCDADTWYPADYLVEAGRLLDVPGRSAAGCFYVDPGATKASHRIAAWHIRIAALLLPSQCHAGGAGQVFRTASLRRVGGFDAKIWNWVLEDHEIMHRMTKVGSLGYGGRFWCAPSPRERDRDSIRWTLGERLLYHCCPAGLRDRFFYDFLGERLRRRRMTSDRIRVRPSASRLVADAPFDLVCG